METRLESSEALVARLLPDVNGDPEDRAIAWGEWCAGVGAAAVLAFVRTANDTPEPDTEILQEAITTAYVEVEHGRYERRGAIPFTAYVKGIARNKIREARRRAWRTVPLEATPSVLSMSADSRLELLIERREQVSLLREGIAVLPADRRLVLERYLRGQSTDEIAEALGISEAAVRQHKSRGVRSLQRYVADLQQRARNTRALGTRARSTSAPSARH